MKKRADGRYVETFTDEKTGKRKYIYGSSPKIVKEKLRNYEEELKNAAGNDGKTFREVAEEWKEIHDKEVEYATRHAYTSCYNGALGYFGDRLVKDIVPNDIKKYIAIFVKKGLAHRTIAIYLIVVKMILNHAIDIEEIMYNPTETVKLPKGLKKNERTMPSNEYIDIIRTNAHTGQMGLFAYFILYSGLRRGEALALQWKDIDFEHKTISVNKITEYVNNRARIKYGAKTSSSIRSVILLDRLAETIQRYQGGPNDYIFQGEHGLITGTEFNNQWIQYCNEMGMHKDGKHDLTPHQLRHAYVTMLYEAGVDAESAILQTGHKKISTMRDIYTHVREKKVKETAEKLNDFDW